MTAEESNTKPGRLNNVFDAVAGIRGALAGSILAVGVMAATSMVSLPAQAQQLCLLRDAAVSQLTKQHGEEVTARGLSANGKFMMELFTGDSGTWTLITTDVNGRSCIVASGEAWSPVPVVPGGPARRLRIRRFHQQEATGDKHEQETCLTGDADRG